MVTGVQQEKGEKNMEIDTNFITREYMVKLFSDD